MATFLFSALANGDTVVFDSAVDVFSFDDPAISAAAIQADSPSATSLSLTVADFSKTVTLSGIALAQVTPTNLVFADGSRILVGDLALGTAGDALGNRIAGTDFNDSLFGLAGNDVLIGGAGDDVLDGGDGDDGLNGGGGNDTASYADAPSGVTVDLNSSTAQNTGGAGLDTLVSIENLRGSAGNDALTGNAGDNEIAGGAGDDTMDGGAGNDTVSYLTAVGGVTVDLRVLTAQNTIGAGTDTLRNFENVIGSRFNDTLIGDDVDNELAGGEGNDFMDGQGGADRASYASATAAVTVNLALTTPQDTIGAGVDTLVNIEKVRGSRFDDTLTGNDGHNIFNGDLGNDTMAGGLGDDVYFVFDTGDTVIEDVNAGHDTIHTAVSYVLSPNVEDMALISFGITAAGNELDNVIGAFPGNNTIDGGLGTDTLTHFFVKAPVQANLATGIVTSSAPGFGTNTVTGFENLTGTSLDDTLTGDGGPNVLDGFPGADTLTGAAGNDTYVVDNPGDVVIEAPNGGTDTVRSLISLTLPQNVENLALAGAAPINATGNALANRIVGNVGNNMLNGGQGVDTMVGGAGNDIYIVANAGDQVNEAPGAGTDTVKSTIDYVLGPNVEGLILIGAGAINGAGNTLNNAMTGNAAANALSGGAGNDVIAGGAGADTLTGGAGADRFDFNLAAESGVGIGLRDVLTDFSAAQQDRIDLSTIDANPDVAGNQAFAFIGAAAFSNVGQVRFAGGLLQANVAGTLAADFEVLLPGITTLGVADLIP